MKIEGVYTEKDWYCEVKVDGTVLTPHASLKLRNHSPDGFAWGYGGSGPAQLALAILLFAGVQEHIAIALYQRFKAQFLVSLPRESFSIEVDLPAWVEETSKTVAVPTERMSER